MAEDVPSLSTLHGGWDSHQQLLGRAVASLSAEQLALRVAPHLRAIGELVAHLIATRAEWMYYALDEGGTQFAELARWDRPDTSARNTTELVNGPELSWRAIKVTPYHPGSRRDHNHAYRH